MPSFERAWRTSTGSPRKPRMGLVTRIESTEIMSASPLSEGEFPGNPAGSALASPVIALGDFAPSVDRPWIDIAIETGHVRRRLSVYEPGAVFALVKELAHLSRRAIEPNLFFDPQFLAPAMPRLDDRKVKLMVVRDETGARSRLRLLMPYSVETASWMRGAPTIRAWTHPFGRCGTLPLDGDDPHDILKTFLAGLTRPELKLPDILVLPDVRLDGAMAKAMLQVAAEAGLPTATVNATTRAALVKAPGIDHYIDPRLAHAGSGRRRRELKRQRRLLERDGPVRIEMAREPDAVRLGLEDFLAIEAGGWKGRQRSALIMDRYRSAFAREAVNALAGDGRCRVFTLKVGEKPVASLIAFVDRGEAYAWKTAYDETFAKASPGQQVMAEATRLLLSDPSVRRADSCAMPDHFVMNRFWPGRIAIGTLVVGLTPQSGRRVEIATRGLTTIHKSKNRLRITREAIKAMLHIG